MGKLLKINRGKQGSLSKITLPDKNYKSYTVFGWGKLQPIFTGRRIMYN